MMAKLPHTVQPGCGEQFPPPRCRNAAEPLRAVSGLAQTLPERESGELTGCPWRRKRRP